MAKKSKFPKPKLYKPVNPEKYIGNSKMIVCRSGIERKFMDKCDLMESITNWSSEELIVPYLDPFDPEKRKVRRYFPDFLIKTKQKDENFKIFMIEIKPSSELKKPTINKRVTKSYKNKLKTWVINQAKWEAAEKYCKKRGWTFLVVTEKDMGINWKWSR